MSAPLSTIRNMNIEIPFWAKPVGLNNDNVQQVVRESAFVSWTSGSFVGIWARYPLVVNVCFHDGKAYPSYTPAPKVAMLSSGAVLPHDGDIATFRVADRGDLKVFSAPSTNETDRNLALLAQSIIPVEVATSIFDQSGPIVTVSVKVIRIFSGGDGPFDPSWVVEVEDADGFTFAVMCSDVDLVPREGAMITVFGALTANSFDEGDDVCSWIAATDGWELDWPDSYEEEVHLGQLQFKVGRGALLGRDVFDTGTFWEAVGDVGRAVPPGKYGATYRSYPDDGVFICQVNWSGYSFAIDIPNKQIRLAITPTDSESHSFGGVLMALEGSVGYLPDDAGGFCFREPQECGHTCLLTARIKNIDTRRVGFDLVFTQLTLDLGTQEATVLLPEHMRSKLEKYQRGGWFSGTVMRVAPMDPDTCDFVVTHGWTSLPDDITVLIQQAQLDRQLLEINYRDAHGNETTRIVEVHDIHEQWAGSYLVAWDRDKDDWRTFLLERIQKCRLVNGHFAPRLGEGDDGDDDWEED